MPADRQYAQLPRPAVGVTHRYGDNIQLLSHPWAMSLLNRLSRAETRQPEVDLLCGALYDWLFTHVASRELLTGTTRNETRMAEFTPAGVYAGEAIDPDQSAVVVDVARAGILPSARFFRGLNLLLDPDRVRQDHIFMNRETDAAGTVTGVNLSGSKIGARSTTRPSSSRTRWPRPGPRSVGCSGSTETTWVGTPGGSWRFT